MKSKLMAVAALLATGGLAHAGLIVNGNFNTDADTNGSPDGWSNWTYGTTGFASYKTDPANDAFDEDGTPYVNAGNYGDWWSSGGGWFQIVPGAAGLSYTFGADSATEDWDNAAGELRLIYLDASSNVIRQDVQNVANYEANKPWASYSLTSVAPEGTAQVKVEIATWGARGAVLWDNADLVAVPEPVVSGILATGLLGAAMRRRRRAALQDA